MQGSNPTISTYCQLDFCFKNLICWRCVFISPCKAPSRVYSQPRIVWWSIFLSRGCCIKTTLLLIDDKLAAPCHDKNSFRKYHLKQWFRPKRSMWLQHFFRASPQTAPSWRSWIRCRLKLLRWSTPWSKFFLVLEIELRDQNCPFHTVCGKILSQTAGGIFERQNSFRRTSLKLSEPNSAFETLNGKSSYVPPETPNIAWSPFIIFFVENSWYRYGANIFLWRTINLR